VSTRASRIPREQLDISTRRELDALVSTHALAEL
jgi:hypothetical protein